MLAHPRPTVISYSIVLYIYVLWWYRITFHTLRESSQGRSRQTCGVKAAFSIRECTNRRADSLNRKLASICNTSSTNPGSKKTSGCLLLKLGHIGNVDRMSVRDLPWRRLRILGGGNGVPGHLATGAVDDDGVREGADLLETLGPGVAGRVPLAAALDARCRQLCPRSLVLAGLDLYRTNSGREVGWFGLGWVVNCRASTLKRPELAESLGTHMLALLQGDSHPSPSSSTRPRGLWLINPST